MLINGSIVPASDGATFDTTSPADGRFLAQVPFAQRADVDRTVEAANAAYPAWRRTPVGKRGTLLQRMIEILHQHAEDLGILDAIESGNPVTMMISEVHTACEWLEYIKGVTFELKGEVLPSTMDHWLFTRREPYGVVGRITAYNHPILFAAQRIGAPLMAGNTLVLKLPEQTSLAPLLMADLIKDVFPPGVLNILSGDGVTTGDALVRHPDVKRLALIGSIETGQRILASAASTGIKHVSLELGGKNPMLVFPDADLDKAALSAVIGMNFQRTQGQSCGSTTRLFLHESIHDKVLSKVLQHIKNIRIGHPLDPQTEMGCLVSEQQYNKVMSYIEIGKQEGAKLVYGGQRPAGAQYEHGYYVEPTVFDGVTMDMRIAREEIFGPVLSVLTWRDQDEVIRQANALKYGLTGAVWTKNIQTALEVADQLDTGYVWINGSSTHFLGAPFSGHKSSGTDAEEGIEELYSYTQVKTVSVGIG
ncbi:MAG: aldehyde dehydrogenase family protein [Ktedonobacteraceae bacterium]|nr:aldehyde dehydrogenase family protein [Ktedonobacteraceae bacterium]